MYELQSFGESGASSCLGLLLFLFRAHPCVLYLVWSLPPRLPRHAVPAVLYSPVRIPIYSCAAKEEEDGDDLMICRRSPVPRESLPGD